MVERVILLVEDNPDDEELTLRALRKNNLVNPVHIARDGAEALDYLFATGPFAGRPPASDPNLVLLDLNLPRVSGLEVLKKMRSEERTKLTPVVVLTSSREEEDILRSYALGANSYVRKPVDFAAFTDAVRTLGIYWLLMNTSPPTPRGT